MRRRPGRGGYGNLAEFAREQRYLASNSSVNQTWFGAVFKGRPPKSLFSDHPFVRDGWVSCIQTDDARGKHLYARFRYLVARARTWTRARYDRVSCIQCKHSHDHMFGGSYEILSHSIIEI